MYLLSCLKIWSQKFNTVLCDGTKLNVGFFTFTILSSRIEMYAQRD